MSIVAILIIIAVLWIFFPELLELATELFVILFLLALFLIVLLGIVVVGLVVFKGTAS